MSIELGPNVATGMPLFQITDMPSVELLDYYLGRTRDAGRLYSVDPELEKQRYPIAEEDVNHATQQLRARFTRGTRGKSLPFEPIGFCDKSGLDLFVSEQLQEAHLRITPDESSPLPMLIYRLPYLMDMHKTTTSAAPILGRLHNVLSNRHGDTLWSLRTSRLPYHFAHVALRAGSQAAVTLERV